MIELLGSWGYYALFAFLFLENVALIGLFVPGLTVLVIAGFFCGIGNLNAAIAYPTAWFAVVAGDTTCYVLGRFFLTRWPRLRRLIAGVKPEQLYGWKSIFFQFPAPTRIAVPLLAGSIKMDAKRAIVIDLIATTVFVTAVGGLGYAAGTGAGTLARAQEWASWLQWFFIGLFIFWVVFLLTKFRAHRRTIAANDTSREDE